jgi:hypothetical protein
MSMLNSAVQRSTLGLHTLEQYEPLIGAATVERIAAKANRVRAMRVAHISSTFYGGGVTELLTPLTLLMNATGVETDWHAPQLVMMAIAESPNALIRKRANPSDQRLRNRHKSAADCQSPWQGTRPLDPSIRSHVLNWHTDDL